MVFTRWNKFRSFTEKKNRCSIYFMLLTLSGRRFIKIRNTSFPLFPVAYPFQVKRENCKVNDVRFPSGCEEHAINLGNKNMKIGIFTGGTSVRSKNIFTDISRYPTGKHEIKNKALANPKRHYSEHLFHHDQNTICASLIADEGKLASLKKREARKRQHLK